MTKKKILVVDDDPDLRIGFHVRLKANGFETSFAADAIGAMAVAEKEQPDLILLDLGLLVGDGFDVLDRLKNHPDLSEVPVIVLTASDPANTKKRALEAGAMAFFNKPVDNDELISAIKGAIP